MLLMSDEAIQYLYLTVNKSVTKDELKEAYKGLSFDDRLDVYRYEHSEYYTEANRKPDAKTHLSNSEKYKLVITGYNSKPGCWSVTLGQVFNIDGKSIDRIYRNHGSFPYEFIENHSNGHDYLICGEHYQGQTIIELDTGKRFDNIPGITNNEWGGFCWTGIKASPNKKFILVNGCYWGASYQYKLYDFSNPLSGVKSFKDINSEDIQEANWLDDSSCLLSIEYEWCLLKNKRTSELTDEEEEEVEVLRAAAPPEKKHSAFYEDREEKRIWKNE